VCSSSRLVKVDTQQRKWVGVVLAAVWGRERLEAILLSSFCGFPPHACNSPTISAEATSHHPSLAFVSNVTRVSEWVRDLLFISQQPCLLTTTSIAPRAVLLLRSTRAVDPWFSSYYSACFRFCFPFWHTRVSFLCKGGRLERYSEKKRKKRNFFFFFFWFYLRE
jgi:hypothetical protein